MRARDQAIFECWSSIDRQLHNTSLQKRYLYSIVVVTVADTVARALHALVIMRELIPASDPPTEFDTSRMFISPTSGYFSLPFLGAFSQAFIVPS
jgi:hypothetical protein